jgi:ribosome-binding protein aMBF1 (putative translation factor)
MQLTPQQRDELERERREVPGRRRFMLEFTPAQREEYRQMVAEEMRAKPGNRARAASSAAALREPTFSGWLRRAIVASDLSQAQIANRLGLEVDAVNQFLSGECGLDSSVIDQLVELLDLAPQLHETNS